MADSQLPVNRGTLHVAASSAGDAHPPDTFLAMRGWGKVPLPVWNSSLFLSRTLLYA